MEGKYSFLDIGDLPEDDDLPAEDPESSEDNFRSDEFLILPKDNYLSALPLDIVAFHFSESGACGYHGVLRIITGDKRKFMVQYFHDDWDSVDMGLGNTLFFINELQPILHEKCKNMARNLQQLVQYHFRVFAVNKYEKVTCPVIIMYCYYCRM